jgi:hypothetical protein
MSTETILANAPSRDPSNLPERGAIDTLAKMPTTRISYPAADHTPSPPDIGVSLLHTASLAMISSREAVDEVAFPPTKVEVVPSGEGRKIYSRCVPPLSHYPPPHPHSKFEF